MSDEALTERPDWCPEPFFSDGKVDVEALAGGYSSAVSELDSLKRAAGAPAERPDWCPEKFFSDGKVNGEALAKSYRAAEAELSRMKDSRQSVKVPKSPDEYLAVSLGLKEDDAKVVADDLQDLAARSHAAGLSVKQYEKLAKSFVEDRILDPNEVLKQVDADPKRAEAIVKNVNGFLDYLKDNGVGDREHELLTRVASAGAGAIKAFEGLRKVFTVEEDLPPVSRISNEISSSVKEVQQKYEQDPNFDIGDPEQVKRLAADIAAAQGSQ